MNGRKCAGLLAEVPVPGAVVIGIGLNVSLRPDELPDTPTGRPATSLVLAGAAEADRTELLAVLLERLGERYGLARAGGDPTRAACGTRTWHVRDARSAGA